MEINQQNIINTERLRIRSAGPGDSAILHSLWTDPRVMTHVGYPQGLGITQEKIEQGMAKQDLSQPFDRYLMVDIKNTKITIGECKMVLPDAEGISRTDVKLSPEHWGHKYGVEIKQALVDYLFENTDCRVVEGTPNVRNVASIRMQEAVGAVRITEDTFHFPEAMTGFTVPVHHYVYHVRRATWEQRRQS